MTMSSRATTTLAVALCVSVFLNLAAAAYIAVGFAGGGGFVRQQTAVLPPELRQEFRAELIANRGPLLAALADLRRDRDTLHGVITAPSLDPAAAGAANAAIRADVDRLLTVAQDALLAAAARLPDDVRRSIPQITAGDQIMEALAGREPGERLRLLRQ